MAVRHMLGGPQSRRALRPLSAALALGVAVVSGARAQPDAPPASTRPLLRVVTGYSSPFVTLPGTPVSGYSVEVWQEVARRLGAETEWQVLPDLSEDAQIAAVAAGQADAAISALAITAEREAQVDFSVPYASSGLQVLVRAGQTDSLGAALQALATPAILWLLLIGAGIALALAHLLWLIERRANPAFRLSYPRAIAEGVWGVMLIIATGEHGDRDAPRPLKRFVVGGMWLLGVVLIAQFTATITAALTVETLRSDIQGPGDLPGRTIATAPGSVAATWLAARDLPFLPVSDTEQAYAMLVRGEVQAIVYEAPQLRHWLATRGPSMASLVGPVFRPETYAIAVRLGSPLRKQVNAALLSMQADGTAEAIERRWFAMPR
ncbi:transporter substrate-binding domain-containing protein [Paracraurococcus lichenis]|uniref:Transporter substrate-binding domain-containing protein n=1 Tax=Paracraurococcus lichenis TaxID=3064888 RepID=A0ABT9E3Y0_9PROT|nr:transporter substrate-binding domain-containing protein [Paracraurococcus sp. LOR1-02]MDO9710817.1 transporter substrate-binding domain-containing protein [Paracraurococcus sp. LOR1-02]